MAFGGSLCYDNRSTIGKYGIGMKTAALSLGPTMEIYSWQEGTGIYRMILDTEEIANERTNVIQVPELSRQWHGLLTRSGRRRARY